jgi:hypothetical protein
MSNQSHIAVGLKSLDGLESLEGPTWGLSGTLCNWCGLTVAG